MSEYIFPNRQIMGSFYSKPDRFWDWAENPQRAGVVLPVPHAIADASSRWVVKNLKGWWVWHRVGADWTVTFQNPLDAARFRIEWGL